MKKSYKDSLKHRNLILCPYCIDINLNFKRFENESILNSVIYEKFYKIKINLIN